MYLIFFTYIFKVDAGASNDNVTMNEVVEPLYNYQEAASATPEVLDAMKLFGYESFRTKQEESIMRILSGKYT